MHLKCIMVLSFYHKGNHGNGSMTNEMKMKPHINNRILHYYLSSWGCTFIHFFLFSNILVCFHSNTTISFICCIVIKMYSLLWFVLGLVCIFLQQCLMYWFFTTLFLWECLTTYVSYPITKVNYSSREWMMVKYMLYSTSFWRLRSTLCSKICNFWTTYVDACDRKI